MRIEIVVHPGSSQRKIIVKDKIYHIYINSRPEKGKANKESIESLAEYFKVRENSITIYKGKTSRKKIVELSSALCN